MDTGIKCRVVYCGNFLNMIVDFLYLSDRDGPCNVSLSVTCYVAEVIKGD